MTSIIDRTSRPLPMRQFARAQTDLLWLWDAAESRMGRRGVDYASMGCGGIDHLGEALAIRVAAATRERRIRRGLHFAGQTHRRILHSVYGEWNFPGFDCFGLLAPLLPESEVARALHARTGTKQPIEHWLIRLSSRIVGVVDSRGNGKIRKRPTATDRDKEWCDLISEDLVTRLVRPALETYSKHAVGG